MKLVTKKIEEAILKVPYASTENVEVLDKKVIAKFFCPCGVGTWYILEDSMYEQHKIVFGLSDLGHGMELGDFSIAELESIKLPFGLTIERDICVEPNQRTVKEQMEIDHLHLM